MNMETYIQHLLIGMNQRSDANEAVHFTRQLEFVKGRTYDIKFAEFKARRFIPVDNSAGQGADSITYRQWDEVGMAKLISQYADDLPRVDVNAREFTQAVKSLGDSYGFSIQDLRRSSMANTQIDTRRARVARTAMESAIDEYAALGNAIVGVTGLLNNANIPIVTYPVAGAWPTLTPAQIIQNMNFIASSIVIATVEVFIPNTLILDQTSFNHIAQTPIAVDNQKTILKSFLENNPYITSIDQWHKTNTAGVGNIRRHLAYKRDPEVLALNIPQEFEQFPPQARNLEFVIPCHARIGGTEIHYPLAMAYGDVAL